MATIRILVVEDDEAIREAVKEILEMENYNVVLAVHGQQALELLRKSTEAPDLILLDLNMPVMPGREFLENLRTSDETWSNVPVLIMTALPDAQINGVSGLLRKPIEIEEILEKIESIVKG